MSLDIWFTLPMDTGNEVVKNEVFSANITSNLGNMANKADFYDALWHLEYTPKGFWTEKGKITFANELSPYLEHGLNQLKTYPEFFKQFNSANGWGMYEHFVPWLEELLEACKKYPIAEVHVSI